MRIHSVPLSLLSFHVPLCRMLTGIALFSVAALCAAAEATTSAAAATAARPTGSAAAKPMVSLLLPLNAPDFSGPAGAVQKGCEAALALEGQAVALDIARTAADPAGIGSAWAAAAGRGAAVIVGPLTRNAVTALAATLAGSPLLPPVTLALNAPEEAASLPLRFHTFGLAVEQESRAVARMAWSDGRRSAVVVQSANALARRSSQAFAAEWLALGGQVIEADDFDAGTDLAQLKARLARPEAQKSDMIFLSSDAVEARRVRPYLINQAAVYATSQVNDGRNDAGANVDLAGVHFVDMPWMMQPDHAAVMVYRRPDYAPELQRFYALGIDACRVALQLLKGAERIELDGVTGRLSLNATPSTRGTAVAREPLMGMFADRSGLMPSDLPATDRPAPGPAGNTP